MTSHRTLSRISRRSMMAFGAGAAFAGALPAGRAAAQNRPANLSLAGGSPGGVLYPVSAGLAKLLTDKGVRTNAEEGAGTSNALNVAAGRADLGIGLSTVNFQAMRGQPPFRQPLATLRGLCFLFEQIVHIMVTQDSGVRSLAELRGKPMAAQPQSAGSTMILNDILRAAGLAGEQDLNVVLRGGPAVGARAVQDRRAIGFHGTVAIPAGAFSEAAVSVPLRLLPIPDDVFAKLAAANPAYSRATIPGGSYTGIAEGVPSAADPAVLMCNAAMPDDHAYWVVRTIGENIETMREMHPSMRAYSRERMTTVGALPLHPGAARYYREIGVLRS